MEIQKSSIFVVKDSVGLRLDNFILQKMPELSRAHIKKMIDEGDVLYQGKMAKAGEKIKLGARVEVKSLPLKPLEVVPQDIDIEIVYEDDDLAVINKPKGMVTHPASGNYDNTLVNALLFKLKNLSGINGVIRPGIVHRLDKDTSGLLIVAKNDKSHINLAKQIETKTCHRYYIALCEGNFKEDEGEIKTGYGRHPKNRKQMSTFPLGEGKIAITHYKVLERFGRYTLVKFKLETGRTHQIRVHCKYLGHPIVGDEVYGVNNKEIKVSGQMLCAYKLELTQPTTNTPLTFEIPLPEYFEKKLNKLRNRI